LNGRSLTVGSALKKRNERHTVFFVADHLISRIAKIGEKCEGTGQVIISILLSA